jgi:hypothetical protein
MERMSPCAFGALDGRAGVHSVYEDLGANVRLLQQDRKLGRP